MANTHKGKFFFLCLLFISASLYGILVNSSLVISGQDDDELQHGHHPPYLEPQTETRTELNQQEVLVHKLEELVRNLSELVARLEPKLQESPNLGAFYGKPDKEQNKNSQGKWGDRQFADQVEEVGLKGRSRDGEGVVRAVSVTKYSPFWSERFQFVSAVKLDSVATCINVLPFRDYEGLSKYVAVGDDHGRVYVFLRNGDVLVEFFSKSDSPVTAMVSYLSVYKNESVVVTGHQNGMILVHKIYDTSNGEEWNSLHMENVGKFEDSENGKEGSAITILEVHHVGRLRYILSSDVSGRIKVFKEDGTLQGSTMPTSKPLAFLKQRLLFLTESGAGSLDLRSMKVKESECEGLNHSLAQNYVFDATERSKAYGFTSEGELIHILLLGDVMNFKCRVRSKRKVDMERPLAFQAIKGYLLIVDEEKVFVYNVSTQHYVRMAGPRLLFSARLDEIRSSFLSYQALDTQTERRKVIPLMASDREKLIILGLGSGYVGIYRSNLPVFKGEFNTMLWTSPVLFFLLFLFGAWQFFAKKKEALTSWGPDDPFSSTSTTTGAPLGSSSGDRPFAEPSTRSSDIMDLRTTSLRGPSRRYVSPPRYTGGGSSTYLPSTADSTQRATSVDPNYRTTSELKYRGALGATMEPPGFPKRRENLFVNNQVGDDKN